MECLLKFDAQPAPTSKTANAREVYAPRFSLSEETNFMDDFDDWKTMHILKNADLNGIMNKQTRSEPIKVDRMGNQTLVEVNEEGVEVTAAAYLPCYFQSCSPKPFNISHPFGFLLWDKQTKSPLSMGRVLQFEGESIA